MPENNSEIHLDDRSYCATICIAEILMEIERFEQLIIEPDYELNPVTQIVKEYL